ncbi:MAG TPA: hypothetical protein VN624_15990 [Rhodanobacter sp.]|nr:hypothetical protein [Rhodanobacter sp.]
MKTLVFAALAASCAAGLAGCATATPTYGPDGRPAYTIECGGSSANWNMCFQKAGELCGTSGYDVIARNGDTGAMASPYGATTIISRSLEVECKKS